MIMLFPMNSGGSGATQKLLNISLNFRCPGSSVPNWMPCENYNSVQVQSLLSAGKDHVYKRVDGSQVDLGTLYGVNTGTYDISDAECIGVGSDRYDTKDYAIITFLS